MQNIRGAGRPRGPQNGSALTFQGGPCKRGHSGLRRVHGGDCVECANARAREKWASDPEARERHLAQRRARYRTPEGQRAYRHNQYMNYYGISLEDYEAMFAAQGGCCAICKKAQEERLRVDHDHASGAVRALLCTTCNLGLGALQDDPKLADAAAAYLRAHGRI